MQQHEQYEKIEKEPPFTFFSLAFLLADGDVTKIPAIRKAPIYWSLAAAEMKLEALERMKSAGKSRRKK